LHIRNLEIQQRVTRLLGSKLGQMRDRASVSTTSDPFPVPHHEPPFEGTRGRRSFSEGAPCPFSCPKTIAAGVIGPPADSSTPCRPRCTQFSDRATVVVL